MAEEQPLYLVGYPEMDPVTDAAPIGDYDTGYSATPRLKERTTGAWLTGDDPEERQFMHIGPVELSHGGRIPNVQIAYETWGELNEDASNAILLCHALTGDSHASSKDGKSGWWHEIVGPGLAIDTNKYFVVCPNVLGGCQGTTGPASFAPDGERWGPRFPQITIRDMCRAEARMAKQLGIKKWHLIAGASFGGNRVMEWAATFPEMTGAIAVLVSGPASTAEQIAYAHLQKLAIMHDPMWRGGNYYDAGPGQGPTAGLGLARQIAHLTYRCPEEMAVRFGRTPQRGENPRFGGRYAVESYLDYHAYKLIGRFDANSYLTINQAFITHDIGYERGGIDKVLESLTMPALVVEVDSDRLFYPEDMKKLAEALPGSGELKTVRSAHGHDGFLIENDQVSTILREFLHKIGDA
ncbi:homoserine O-acetyltransferase [Actinotignum urinale]|uniref:Homoserine O-acetyltransferase n=1 Tax=Actinotignum urinale TaxID=190146 RepID=A0AAW9HR98_9ACTO|nr:homoserine O-acetyltransferase [Actinotignum urinale]MDY5129377.1 homoserine O-acetyltransferase [Actinotignum urinale]MDY5132961.1 homoserine O-acetyltransferase [Actinotignum urinale]MDY5151544.1 homoserine O-acetyltransferase [Actinotignum urinale]MDY5155192.1 homoserine O-acetyltransferase [Actinotignum urinale]WIK59449.1 homoserine O-acetyltransferase [Actinotignum urinale]